MKADLEPNKRPRPVTVVGWQERISLPDLGVRHIKAKFDTGARTSALHATGITAFERDGHEWVRFETYADEDQTPLTVEAPIADQREIRNTGGKDQERYVIRTTFALGGQRWPIDVSLVARPNMKFQMIVGRTALKDHAIAVHTKRAHLTRNEDQGA